MKNFSGKVLFLDRSDINTDEIIPARYLTEITKDALKPYLLEDLSLEGFDPAADVREAGVIVTRSNFGCGSSREHAPWALEVNGINLVIAEDFARIFRQNMYNCGMIAIEMDKAVIEDLFKSFSTTGAVAEFDISRQVIRFKSGTETRELPLILQGFDLDLVKAGGWVSYADSHY